MATFKPKPPKNKRTDVENIMAKQLREHGIYGYRRNARFIDGRRFQADFFFPSARLVLEVDGGVYMVRGGHTTGTGYTNDRERNVEGLLQGILTVRYTSDQVRKGYAIETFKKILAARRAEKGLAP